MSDFFTVLAIGALCAALLPTRWGLRLWIALAMPTALVLLAQHEVQFMEQGIFHGLAESILRLILAVGLAGVALRWFLSTILIRALRPPAVLSKTESSLIGLTDRVLAVLAGLCSGPPLTILLALVLRGTPGGLSLHVFVAALAGAAVVLFLLFGRGMGRDFAVPALSVLAVMALLGGFAWPERIEERAAAKEPGLERCLRAVDHVAGRDEMMLLTLPKGRPGAPGLILTVMTPEGPRHYRWSYRADNFVRYGAYRHGGCPD